MGNRWEGRAMGKRRVDGQRRESTKRHRRAMGKRWVDGHCRKTMVKKGMGNATRGRKSSNTV